MSNIWTLDINDKLGRLWTGVYFFFLFFLLVFLAVFFAVKLYFSFFYEAGKLFFKKEGGLARNEKDIDN